MLQGSGWIVSESCWFNCAVSLELAVYWWCFSVAVFLSLIFISSHLDRYKMINRYFFTNCYSIEVPISKAANGQLNWSFSEAKTRWRVLVSGARSELAHARFFTVPALPEAVADINISVLAVPVAPGPRSKSICLYLQLTRGAVLCVVL